MIRNLEKLQSQERKNRNKTNARFTFSYEDDYFQERLDEKLSHTTTFI